MVAAQGSASFDVCLLKEPSKRTARTKLMPAQHHHGNDPAVSKAKAGEGNTVNPLELSPATPDLSKVLEDKVCHKALSSIS